MQAVVVVQHIALTQLVLVVLVVVALVIQLRELLTQAAVAEAVSMCNPAAQAVVVSSSFATQTHSEPQLLSQRTRPIPTQ
jgi:hypothetical protein